MQTRLFHILIVDDNPTDLMIMREAFKNTRVEAVLESVSNGDEAMKFLRRVGGFSKSPRPDLIILDLNMPRKNGHEVLAEIKSDPLLLRIPVIILTTSQAEEDVSRAYAAHANCYVRKPVDFVESARVMAVVESFWFNTVTLPVTKPYVA